MKLKKSVWAFAAVVFTVLTSGLINILPQGVYAADSLPWQTPAGAEGDFNNINFLGRVRFDSPVRITDTATNQVYTSDASIFGNQNEDYLNNGGDNNAWYVYAPVGSDNATPTYKNGSTCYGVYMLELDKDGNNAWLHAMQPVLGQDGATCVYDNNSKSVKVGRVPSDVESRNNIVEIGSWEGGTIDGNSDNFRDAGAAFFWRSKDVIGAFDSAGEGLTELTSPQLDVARTVWTTDAMGNVPSLSIRQQAGWRYFGSADCGSSAFLAVDPNNAFIYPVKIESGTDGSSSTIDEGPWDQCIWGRDINNDSTGQFDLPSYKYVLAYRQNATLSADQVDDSVFGGSGSTADPAAGETAVSCNNRSNSVIGWIICPVLDILDNMTERMTEAIQGFLVVDMDQFATNTELYQAWNVIRQISTIIIVIIALVMIFSEAMGAGFMDNYSVKKLLPRLILAGIGIQLSWVLLRLLIEVTNALGNGIGGILMSPFNLTMTDHIKNVIENSGGAGAGLFTSGLTSSGGSQGVLFGALVIGGAALLGIGSIFGLAIGVVAAVIIGFITLILRNIVIYLGMVLAPIGMAMSVLPGTQKMSKLWWESFEKALIMFPLIMGLLASGRIVSKLILDGAQGGFEIVAGIVAWYAPFFLLPATLKLGGTVLGKVSGIAGNANKGFFDKARKWNDTREDGRKKMKSFIRDARTNSDIAAGGIRGGRARARRAFANIKAGSVGVGEASDLIRADRESKLAKQATELGSARIANSGWGNAGTEYFDKNGKLLSFPEAQVEIAKGEKVTFKDVRGQVTKLDASDLSDTLTVSAIINKMAADGNIGALRQVKETMEQPNTENTAIGRTLKQSYNNAVSQNVGTVVSKAPDLVKSAGGAFGEFKAEDVVSWDKSTVSQAIEHLSDENNFTTTGADGVKRYDPSKHQKAWSTFGSALDQIQSNAQLKQRMGAGSVENISKALGDLNESSVINKVDPSDRDKTIQISTKSFAAPVQQVIDNIVKPASTHYNSDGSIASSVNTTGATPPNGSI